MTKSARCVGLLGSVAALALAACGGADAGSDTTPDPTTSTPGSSGSTPPPPGVTPAPGDLPAPVAVAKTYERTAGTSVTGRAEASGASDVTFEIVTPPKQGNVGWIDATKGDFLYRPSSLASAVADEFEYVAKANGKTSTPTKVTITVKALDFSKAMPVRGARQSWYSYNLSINFNNGGSSDCGPQEISIAGGTLAQRNWTCGMLPEIAVSVGSASVTGGTSSSGGSFRKLQITRTQLDARLDYREQSTDCSSYNSTLNSCNAGLSEDTTGGVYLGVAPTTTTAPVVLPSRCETSAGKPCEGFIVASDAESDRLTFEVPTAPKNGNVNIDAAMKGFSYNPKAGFVGTDTFTLVARDASAASSPVTITVVVK